MSRKKDDYYRSLSALADYACQTADLLLSAVESMDWQLSEQNLAKARECRKKSEVESSLVRQRLKNDFITPLEREDIWTVAFSIMEITEKEEEGLFCCCLLLQGERVSKRQREILAELSEACVTGSREIERGVSQLKNYKESTALPQCLAAVRKLHRQAEETLRQERRMAAAGSLKLSQPVPCGLFEEASSLLLSGLKACENTAMAMELASIKN